MSEVLVVLEATDRGWHRTSLEAVAAGTAAAHLLSLPLTAVSLTPGSEGWTDQIPAGPERILVAQAGALRTYTADAYAGALHDVVQKRRPRLVVLPHTYQVRDYAPRAATRSGAALISDVVELRQDDAGALMAVRQLFQGKLNAEIALSGDGPQFISVQAGAFRTQELPAAVPVEAIEVALPAAIRTRPEDPFRETQGAVDLTAAERIVAAGRGIREQENLQLVQELAEALGAELAASRPICDNGWLPMERQIGSSGQTVAPKLYVAVGISGAIQHLVGMKGAKTIVAINKDPEAPIFEIADYGIAGDLFDVVPALIKELKRG
jgi:electron transfer flavoprotein alpha subunit